MIILDFGAMVWHWGDCFNNGNIFSLKFEFKLERKQWKYDWNFNKKKERKEWEIKKVFPGEPA